MSMSKENDAVQKPNTNHLSNHPFAPGGQCRLQKCPMPIDNTSMRQAPPPRPAPYIILSPIGTALCSLISRALQQRVVSMNQTAALP